MSYLNDYLQKYSKKLIIKSMNDYKIILDIKLKNIERYINYLNDKKIQLLKLIDSLTTTLENKYIDLVETQNIQCAEEIHDYEINDIKKQLNQFEASFARIESDLVRRQKEKLETENECQIMQHISLVA